MVHFHKDYNKLGENEFSSVRNCQDKLLGWMSLFFLAVIFMFSGISIAIATDQKGFGVIMSVVGIIGIIFSLIFFIKIKRNK